MTWPEGRPGRLGPPKQLALWPRAAGAGFEFADERGEEKLILPRFIEFIIGVIDLVRRGK